MRHVAPLSGDVVKVVPRGLFCTVLEVIDRQVRVEHTHSESFVVAVADVVVIHRPGTLHSTLRG